MLHPYVVGGEAGPADNDEEDGDYSGDGEDDEKVGDEDDDDVDSDDRCTHISWVVLIWGLRITLSHNAIHYAVTSEILVSREFSRIFFIFASCS